MRLLHLLSAIEELGHVKSVVSDLVKSGPPYPEPTVKPFLAQKYSLIWNPMTARWIADSKTHAQLNQNHIEGVLDEYMEDLTEVETNFAFQEEYADNLELEIYNDHTYLSLRGELDAKTRSVYQYVRSEYDVINQDLSEGNITEDAMNIAALMRNSEEDIILYRSITANYSRLKNNDGLSGWHQGEIVTNKGFTSTSRSALYAWDFASFETEDEEYSQQLREDRVFLQIRVPAGTSMITLANSDTLEPEFETILNYGMSFYIEEVIKPGDYEGVEQYIIKMTALPAPSVTEWDAYQQSTFGNLTRSGVKSYAQITAKSSRLHKAGPPYDQPRVKPEYAIKYGLDWNPMTARWVAPEDLIREVNHHVSQLKDSHLIPSVNDLKDMMISQYNETIRLDQDIKSWSNYVNMSSSFKRVTKSPEFALSQYLLWHSKSINQKILEGDITPTAQKIQGLMGVTDSPTMLYRNIVRPYSDLKNNEGLNAWHPSEIVTFKAFSSTSRAAYLAWNFGVSNFPKHPNDPRFNPAKNDDHGVTFLQLMTPAGTPSIAVKNGEVSPFDEFETLVGHGVNALINEVHVSDHPQYPFKRDEHDGSIASPYLRTIIKATILPPHLQ